VIRRPSSWTQSSSSRPSWQLLNRLAHAAAQAVAEPLVVLQPAFIYGDSGWARHTCCTHRELRLREFPSAQGALRHHRDVHERLRRLPCAPRPPWPLSVATANVTSYSSTTSSSWRTKRVSRRSLPHLQRPEGRLEADRPHVGPPPKSIETLEDRLRSRSSPA